jgi:hypothetical protein
MKENPHFTGRNCVGLLEMRDFGERWFEETKDSENCLVKLGTLGLRSYPAIEQWCTECGKDWQGTSSNQYHDQSKASQLSQIERKHSNTCSFLVFDSGIYFDVESFHPTFPFVTLLRC